MFRGCRDQYFADFVSAAESMGQQCWLSGQKLFATVRFLLTDLRKINKGTNE